MPIPTYLLSKCQEVFNECQEVFRDQTQVENFFAAEEIAHCLGDLEQANSINARIRNTLRLLTNCCHYKHGLALPFFLELLCSNYHIDNPVRDKLDKLHQEVKQALKSSRLIATEQDKQTLYNLILDIDFNEQLRAFEEVTSLQKVAVFLIHGPQEYGQEILIRKICNKKINNNRSKIINIDIISSEINENIDAVWLDIAERLNVSKEFDHKELANMLYEILETQNIILTFNGIGHTHPNFISDFTQKFWQPVFNQAQEKDFANNTNHFVIFLIDDAGHIGHFCQFTNPCSELSTIPVLKKFQVDTLEDWLNGAKISLSHLEELSPQALFESSSEGIPKYVYRKICQHCFIDWEEDLLQCFS